MTPASWLPAGRRAAVVFSVDDVHPAGTVPGGDADVARRALGVVARLQERHPRLAVTFFTTPDWRSASPDPAPGFAARLPLTGQFAWHVPVLPAGTYRLSNHPAFCATLRAWPRGDVALHGLHHVRRGPRPLVECDGLGEAACRALIVRGRRLLDEAGVPYAPGFAPPGWSAPAPLLRALARAGMSFFGSARDLDTPVSADARAAGSGLLGVPLFSPELLPGTGLVHVPVNFQATSAVERARAVAAAGGLLSIKAHLLSGLGSYRAHDGLTDAYGAHLDRVLSDLEDAHGDALWWPTLSELAESARAASPAEARA